MSRHDNANRQQGSAQQEGDSDRDRQHGGHEAPRYEREEGRENRAYPYIDQYTRGDSSGSGRDDRDGGYGSGRDSGWGGQAWGRDDQEWHGSDFDHRRSHHPDRAQNEDQRHAGGGQVGRTSGFEQGGYGGYDLQRSDQQRGQPSDQNQDDFDPDYHQWRRDQIDALDKDYREFRQERYKKFSDEFATWRSNRSGQPSNDAVTKGTSSGPASTASSGVSQQGKGK